MCVHNFEVHSVNGEVAWKKLGLISRRRAREMQVEGDISALLYIQDAVAGGQ